MGGDSTSESSYCGSSAQKVMRTSLLLLMRALTESEAYVPGFSTCQSLRVPSTLKLIHCATDTWFTSSKFQHSRLQWPAADPLLKDRAFMASAQAPSACSSNVFVSRAPSGSGAPGEAASAMALPARTNAVANTKGDGVIVSRHPVPHRRRGRWRC